MLKLQSEVKNKLFNNGATINIALSIYLDDDNNLIYKVFIFKNNKILKNFRLIKNIINTKKISKKCHIKNQLLINYLIKLHPQLDS